LGYEPNELPDCSTPRHLKNPNCNTQVRLVRRSTDSPVIHHLKLSAPAATGDDICVAHDRKPAGTTLANGLRRMSMMLELLLVLSSVGLSVVLSRLAVGEMFRLVRIDRVPAPVTRDDATR
jgi:hypothetical protein